MYQMYGVVPPMITPFQENGAVDFDSLKTLVNFLSEHVDGLFINGSYGGGVLMTEEERKAMDACFARAAEAAECFVLHGIDKAMNTYNTKA